MNISLLAFGAANLTPPLGQQLCNSIYKHCRFPEILQAYDAVARWIYSHGYQIAASPREIYFNQTESIAPDDPFCDIAWQFG
ncbi:MAG: hypothetical protein Kow00121_26270 [Elainellaceae cyanobacterium]